MIQRKDCAQIIGYIASNMIKNTLFIGMHISGRDLITYNYSHHEAQDTRLRAGVHRASPPSRGIIIKSCELQSIRGMGSWLCLCQHNSAAAFHHRIHHNIFLESRITIVHTPHVVGDGDSSTISSWVSPLWIHTWIIRNSTAFWILRSWKIYIVSQEHNRGSCSWL